MKITTNHQPRPIIHARELSPEERAEFDYLDWKAIDSGSDSASFIRYQGTLYDLGEFSRIIRPDETRRHPMECSEPAFQGWHAYQSETYFSGLLIRWANIGQWPHREDFDSVIVGRYCC